MNLDIERRKDARITFDEITGAVCEANNCYFKVFVNNLSTSGIFVNTMVHSFVIGENILLKINFIHLNNNPAVSGKVIRIESDGIAIKFELVFKM